jgi:hypothetical protein
VLVKRPRDDLVQGAAAVTALLLMAHAAVDFDWTQPSNLSMVGLVGALAFSSSAAERRRRRSTHSSLAVLLVAVLAFSAYATRHWDNAERLRATPHTAADSQELVDFAGGGLGDYRTAVQVLGLYDNGQPIPPDQVRRAVQLTADIGDEDRGIALQRASALARLGDQAAAVRVIDEALASLHDSAPSFWSQAGRALVLAGEREKGRAMLVRAVDFGTTHGGGGLYWSAVTGLLETDTGSPGGLPQSDRCLVSDGIHLFGTVPVSPLYDGLGVDPKCPRPAGSVS